ncbi:YybH family protein [Cyclobacterium plantarum]|uniref:SgcJ/EcaC family oxidoreductase n=1 Tax=Cyclobacterium plantarum TaxID=2716263 RepID=A0ABX0H6P8_9BACT|nr:SgcJ/EcaC family oxidoreductase [Cyclobacterium plantarum]NHE57540.1 SgcJ/EcaC family oxidoreductase [Cyclobacterium plantarum]
MKILFPIIIVILIAFIGLYLFFTPQISDGNVEEDIAAITAMSKARADAFNSGDAVTIASYFTEGAFLMAPATETKIGPQAVEAYYQEIFDRYHTELESGYEQVKVDGNLAYGRGFAKVTLYEKSTGDTLHSTSKYLNILERQADGSWKTTHDIWNGNE